MSMTAPGGFTKNPIQGFKLDPELRVGDLVMWDGKPSEHCSFRHGIVYRVIDVKMPEEEPKSSYAIPRYKFVAVFDFNRPVGRPIDSFEFSTIRDLKKLGLLDLGTLRLHFDNFIREWAKQEGMEVDESR